MSALPVRVTSLTVRLAPPVLAMVTVRVAEAPNSTSPKAAAAGLTETLRAATALPASDTVTTGLAGSSLAMSSVPAAAPTALGANCTVTGTVAPRATLNGVAGAPGSSAKPAPLTVSPEITQSVLPLLPMVVERVTEPPSSAVPKSRLSGATVIAQPPVGCTPSPASATVTVGVSGSSLVMVTVPASLPTSEGV